MTGRKLIITELALGDRRIRLSGLTEDGRLLEARAEPLKEQDSGAKKEETGRIGDGWKADRSLLGNIYVGRVQRIVPNLHAAFIEIAPGKACYYPISEKEAPVFVKKIPSPRLVQGDELLVQVKKEAVKTKAPVVTANLNLSGRYAVVTSNDHRVGVSGKLTREKQEHFKALIRQFFGGQLSCGVIIRTNAGEIPDEDVLAEVGRLKAALSDLIQKAAARTCFSCVYQANPRYLSYLQDVYQEGLSEILTDLPEVYAKVEEYRRDYPALLSVPLRLYADPLLPLANLYNLHRQLERALQKNVWLKSGGYLVIEPTEALTVIDVNTGKSMDQKNPQKHFLKTNLEAADEIAAQIRLRNLSGIVIIDFIDLASAADRETVMRRLRAAVKEDPVPVYVVDMTKLELVEMTRKKIEKSLAEQLG